MSESTQYLAHNKSIENVILIIRNQRVMLDVDLARIYGVSTKRLNQQVKRNLERFPADFMFQLTVREKKKVVTNCDHLKKLKFSKSLPYAFSEHGTVMLANVIKSGVAVKASIQIVRTFIKLREMALAHYDLLRKIDTLEKKYDVHFKIVFDTIRQLRMPNPSKRNRIGF